jgi:hypothetical protein
MSNGSAFLTEKRKKQCCSFLEGAVLLQRQLVWLISWIVLGSWVENYLANYPTNELLNYQTNSQLRDSAGILKLSHRTSQARKNKYRYVLPVPSIAIRGGLYFILCLANKKSGGH